MTYFPDGLLIDAIDELSPVKEWRELIFHFNQVFVFDFKNKEDVILGYKINLNKSDII